MELYDAETYYWDKETDQRIAKTPETIAKYGPMVVGSYTPDMIAGPTQTPAPTQQTGTITPQVSGTELLAQRAMAQNINTQPRGFSAPSMTEYNKLTAVVQKELQTPSGVSIPSINPPEVEQAKMAKEKAEAEYEQAAKPITKVDKDVKRYGELLAKASQGPELTTPEDQQEIQRLTPIAQKAEAENQQRLSFRDQLKKQVDDATIAFIDKRPMTTEGKQEEYANTSRHLMASFGIIDKHADETDKKLALEHEQIADMKIDPNRLFSNEKNWPSLLALAMTAAAEGFQAGFNKTQNPQMALKLMNIMIDRDIESQKDEIMNKRAMFKDEQAGMEAQKSSILQALGTQLDVYRANIADYQTRENAFNVSKDLKIKASEARMNAIKFETESRYKAATLSEQSRLEEREQNLNFISKMNPPGAGVKTPKPPPATMLEQFTSVSSFNNVLDEYEKAWKDISVFSQLGRIVPNSAIQKFEFARNAATQQLVYLQSGKQINEQEFERMKSLLIQSPATTSKETGNRMTQQLRDMAINSKTQALLKTARAAGYNDFADKWIEQNPYASPGVPEEKETKLDIKF